MTYLPFVILRSPTHYVILSDSEESITEQTIQMFHYVQHDMLLLCVIARSAATWQSEQNPPPSDHLTVIARSATQSRIQCPQMFHFVQHDMLRLSVILRNPATSFFAPFVILRSPAAMSLFAPFVILRKRHRLDEESGFSNKSRFFTAFRMTYCYPLSLRASTTSVAIRTKPTAIRPPDRHSEKPSFCHSEEPQAAKNLFPYYFFCPNLRFLRAIRYFCRNKF